MSAALDAGAVRDCTRPPLGLPCGPRAGRSMKCPLWRELVARPVPDNRTAQTRKLLPLMLFRLAPKSPSAVGRFIIRRLPIAAVALLFSSPMCCRPFQSAEIRAIGRLC